MDRTLRLNINLDLTSDLFEHLSDSSLDSESGDSHSDSGSSIGSGSDGGNSDNPIRSDIDRGNGLEHGRGDDSQGDSNTGSGSGSGSDYDGSDEDDASEELNFELDELESRLTRLIQKAFDKFNDELEDEAKNLPFDELHTENRSELESCLVSFYSQLREQASSCLYTFYGPKSYEFGRLLGIAISREERREHNSFSKLWAKRCEARDQILSPPLSRRLPPPARVPRHPPKPPPPVTTFEVKDTEQIDKDLGAGDEKRVWNHITISRDQTRASNFTKELLKILLTSTRNQTADTGNTNHHPHAPEREFYSSDSDSSGSPASPFHPPERKLGNEQLNLDRPDYFERVPVPILSANGPGPSTNYIQHRNFANRMTDQPQTRSFGESSRTEINGSNLQPDVPGSASDSQPAVDGSLIQLMGRLATLETENRDLKVANRSVARSETVYFIQVDRRSQVPYLAFLDEPTWAVGPGGETVLKSHFGIHDINGFLRQKNDVAFVINKYYDLAQQDQEVRAAVRDKRALPRAECSRETIRFQSFEMIQAAEEFFNQQPNFTEEFPGLNISNGIGAPYLFWYYYRSKNALEGLSPSSLESMKLLTSWIEDNYGELYDLVEDQLKRGVVSAKTIEFLVKPGDVVVWTEKRDLTAAVAESWPLIKKTPQARQGFSLDSRRDDWGTKHKDDEAIPQWKSNVKCWQYGFDGSYYRRARPLEISFKAENQEEEVPITKLSAYPLQYAPEEWEETLEARGKMSWSCRHQRIASYEDDRGLYGNSERFMIDFHTYEQLHSDSNSFKKSYPTIDDPNVKRMDAEVMASDNPPPVPDLYVFPNTVPAYNLRSKKWVDLEVDKIRDVTWNKKSFEHLVVDVETKDLIQALITNQIARGQGTDTIDGKGNGLIILLHGGPGTGKTFTAESVAEMAEKPLFRVTCGDIGTKPEEVEKYLESVLHLGKNWGCVVLLDEADVFLEQRTLTDLERNALVSVFLRVLEYYEGILILTSNRVGTFDEAFKSRIQLSLHYENLTEGQRGRVWKNFLNRLKDLEAQNATAATSSTTSAVNGERSLTDRGPPHSMGIDFDDVECYLSDLARVEMNGRQIRNAITTARQLAKFKGELMAYHHLRHVIKVSSKFDSYLKNVQEGYSDDQIARGDGIR